MKNTLLHRFQRHQVFARAGSPHQSGLRCLILALIICACAFNSAKIEAQKLDEPTGPFIKLSEYVPPPSLNFSNKISGYILPITHYLQCDQYQSWGSLPYGSAGCSSICINGCALTCSAMLLKLNGVNVNPGQLNSYLQSNNYAGYNSCSVRWVNGSGISVDNYPGNTMSWSGSIPYYLPTIKSQIDGGNPVIVHVVHSYLGTGTEHFVVIYGYNGAGTNAGDFLVSDPGSSTFPVNWSYYTLYPNDANPLRIYNNVTPAPPTCSVPTNIYAANITSNFANIYCNTVNGASQYSIGIKPSYNTAYTYYTVNSLPFYMTNLLSGTTYNYKIAAYCSLYGWSGYSSLYSFTTSSSSTCTTPYSVYVSAISSTSVTINWTSSGAVSYNYYLKPASQSSYWTYTNYTYKPIIFSSLTPSTAYNFRVSSNCSGSTSLQSSILTFTTPAYRLGDEDQTLNGNVTLSGNYLNVSPNPIKAGVSLKFESRVLPKEVFLSSIDGKILSRKMISENSYEIPSEISPGIYFLKAIFDNGNISTIKVVVQ
jgi:hypothetical protein